MVFGDKTSEKERKARFWKEFRVSAKRIGRALGMTVPIFLLLLWWTASLYADRDYQRKLQVDHDRSAAAKDLLQQTALAAVKYAAAHDGQFPAALDWESDLVPYLGKRLPPLPPNPDEQKRRIVMNRAFSEIRREKIIHPAEAVVFFESVSTARKPMDRLTSLPPAESVGGFAVGYADGHADYVDIRRRDEIIAHDAQSIQK